ncbi:hypothetical protein ACFTQ7_08515 [Lysinibacillus sp. NPDC056959]|uniref:hypothetical protein n=1 Tax=Lysinibacillus sp. NPDC056959 TaxID=3345981 RepID=UPI003624F1F1
MRNCPNCLAINPFKKVHRDGAEIEICEYCNTIKEEECEEYPKKQVQNKNDSDPIVTVAIGYTVGVVFFVILIMGILNYS